MDNKKELRKLCHGIRDGIPAVERRLRSKIITEKLFSLPQIGMAKKIFCYASFKSEVETEEIINRLLNNGVVVALPLCDKDTHTMKAIVVESFEELKEGNYGIYEPPKDSLEISAENIDLVIVPALAFDRKGNRLGYGAGYYDRFLENYKGIVIGINFSEMILPNIPTDLNDHSMDIIVTDKEIINVKGN